MRASRHEAVLHGLKVLVVEDQYLIADEMARAVKALGGEVIGPVGQISSAASLADARPDLALLDINLHGEEVYPVALTLRERNVPVIFATGYSPPNLPAEFSWAAHLEKPVTVGALAAAVRELGMAQ